MYYSKIDVLVKEYKELMAFFHENGQISFGMFLDNVYKKALLLSASSYFESVIIATIHDYAASIAKSDNKLVAFIDNKALERQYHTMFDWTVSNTNKFWSLFGGDEKIRARKKLDEEGLQNAEQAFLTIGKERNELVHRNFVEANVNYTFEEIYIKYQRACDFIDFVSRFLPA
jgi:hypothetical protein